MVDIVSIITKEEVGAGIGQGSVMFRNNHLVDADFTFNMYICSCGTGLNHDSSWSHFVEPLGLAGQRGSRYWVLSGYGTMS